MFRAFIGKGYADVSLSLKILFVERAFDFVVID